MWPFSKSPWRKVEEGMKSIYPSDRTGLDYLFFLSESPCPILVCQLCASVYLRNDRRSIAAINKWLAIMRSSRNVLQVAQDQSSIKRDV